MAPYIPVVAPSDIPTHKTCTTSEKDFANPPRHILSFHQDAHLTLHNAAEIVGKVQPDLSIKSYQATDFGTNIGQSCSFFLQFTSLRTPAWKKPDNTDIPTPETQITMPLNLSWMPRIGIRRFSTHPTNRRRRQGYNSLPAAAAASDGVSSSSNKPTSRPLLRGRKSMYWWHEKRWVVGDSAVRGLPT